MILDILVRARGWLVLDPEHRNHFGKHQASSTGGPPDHEELGVP